jgi:two-component system nitrate/nitrite response regulator NarL
VPSDPIPSSPPEPLGNATSDPAKARIVVADDHPIVRSGIQFMLQDDPRFEIVGEAEDGDVAVQQTLELQPDALLLDLAMPRLSGLEAMKAILSKDAHVKIVMFTRSITTKQVIEALELGARGILLKDATAAELKAALVGVLEGDYWIGERVSNPGDAMEDLRRKAAMVPERKTFGLTPRELEIVICIVEGCSNKEIARRYTISERTVHGHLSNIFGKCGVSTRLELALFAIARKLVEPEC